MARGTPCETRHRQGWPATRRRPERGPGRGNAAPGDAASSADTAPMPKVAPCERDTGERGRRTPRRRTRLGRGNAAPANAAASADTARTARVTRCEHAAGETGRASPARAGNADGTGNPGPPRWLRGRMRRGGRRSSMGTAARGAATKRARRGRGHSCSGCRTPAGDSRTRRRWGRSLVGSRMWEELDGERGAGGGVPSTQTLRSRRLGRTRRGWGCSPSGRAPSGGPPSGRLPSGSFPSGLGAVGAHSVASPSVGRSSLSGRSPSGVLRRGHSIGGGGREPGVLRSGGPGAERPGRGGPGFGYGRGRRADSRCRSATKMSHS